jgi:hypothetical protein
MQFAAMIVNPLHPLTFNVSAGDLAGDFTAQPNRWLMQHRLKTLAQQYLSPERLSDRLSELPRQFQQPQPRPWQRIHWSNIDASQIIGINPLVFIAILTGAADTEDPIRGYTQTSRQYLEPLYPEMARFVGGVTDCHGQLVELGLWEKEERRHTPALQKLYTQLTGLNLRLVPHSPRPYQATTNPHTDLYHHGLHRIATEYGAACLYLWLMAHTTGALQTVLEELFLDEINHMTKFLGFGLWAFPDSGALKVCQALSYSAFQKLWNTDKQSSLLHTLRRVAQVLHWEAWSFSNKMTFGWTFAITLQQLQGWSRSLTSDYLEGLFGKHPGHPTYTSKMTSPQ